MKWIVLFLCMPVVCFSQKVRMNVYDNFTKKHRIELEPVMLQSAPTGRVNVSFTSTASDLYLQLSGYGWGASTIDDGNELIFLFSNDSTLTLHSTGLQTFDPGLQKSTYKHQYRINQANLRTLAQYELIGIRKYAFKEFSDLSIAKGNTLKLQKPSVVFLNELKKANVLKTLKQIDAKDIASHVGDSVVFCSKIYNSRYYESSPNKPTVLDVQSNFDDPLVNVVILDEDRRNFPDAPEKVYLNKEVCISGIVTIRNNVPYVIAHRREQVKVKTPATLDDIALHVGDTVTVTGKIYSAKYFADSKTLPTLLNMGAPFPDQPLTVVIEKADRIKFEKDPEIFYMNKDIAVTGQVVLFKGKPQIVVRGKEQLRVLNNSGFVTANSTASTPGYTLNNTTASKTSSVQRSFLNEAETQAQFPGGEVALSKFLSENLVLPEQLNAGQTKTVLASFYVDVDGGIKNIQIVNSAGKNYDSEAVRVLRKMPKWQPKTKGNLLMGVVINQPITFRGSEE